MFLGRKKKSPLLVGFEPMTSVKGVIAVKLIESQREIFLLRRITNELSTKLKCRFYV